MGAGIMIATSLAYLCIQIPAFALEKDDKGRIIDGEHNFALTGLILCFVCFTAYLGYQFKVSGTDEVKNDKINEIAKSQMLKGNVSLLGRSCLTLAPSSQASH
jgi:hypothetical protein